MNLTRCSKLGGLALCLVLAVALTGTALAFEVSADGVAEEYQVGSDVSVTYTIEDPFTNVSNQYVLEGETELTNVSWNVEVYRAGTQIGENTYGGGNFSQALDVNNNGDEVRVILEGTTPAIANYTYAPEEQFLVANLTRVSGNNPTTFRTDTAHYYTADSADARAAIEAAQAAIEAAGGHEDAEGLVDNAISAYEAEDFDNAIDLAEQAENQAEQAQQSAQQTQLILMVVGALIVVGLLVGGVLYWRSQREEYTKL